MGLTWGCVLGVIQRVRCALVVVEKAARREEVEIFCAERGAALILQRDAHRFLNS